MKNRTILVTFFLRLRLLANAASADELFRVYICTSSQHFVRSKRSYLSGAPLLIKIQVCLIDVSKNICQVLCHRTHWLSRNCIFDEVRAGL